MSAWLDDGDVRVLHGDCIEQMKLLPAESIDAVCTDPPYALSFMSREWDTHASPLAFQIWCQEWAAECLRVLKPGGHLVAFSGTRTAHRMVCGIEDAGFEIRDTLAWLYGSGFPKSLDVSKAIDKRRDDTKDGAAVAAYLAAALRDASLSPGQLDAENGDDHKIRNYVRPDLGRTPPWDEWVRLKARVGFGHEMDAEVWRLNGRKGTPGEAWHEREVIGRSPHAADRSTPEGYDGWTGADTRRITAPATPDAERWQGWGTALKPAHEPITLARKPLRGTVAGNVLEFGTGALNIDATRIGTTKDVPASPCRTDSAIYGNGASLTTGDGPGFDPNVGRWPANVILDPEAAAILDQQTGELASGQLAPHHTIQARDNIAKGREAERHRERTFGGDRGGASRFFKTVQPDTLCVLCDTPCVSIAGNPSSSGQADGSAPEPAPDALPLEPADNTHPSAAPARNAARSSITTPATAGGATAQPLAPLAASERIVRLARSAASLCDSCATAIAQSVAQSLQGRTPASGAGAGSTVERRQRTLSRSLALIAAGSASTGITPTTSDLRASFGCALAATDDTTPANGSASGPTRFRYTSKASSGERNDGLADRNGHPTVKSVDLMRWLIRLLAPPGALILDPFAGSGTTGVAARAEQVRCVLIEREAEYLPIIAGRLSQLSLFSDA